MSDSEKTHQGIERKEIGKKKDGKKDKKEKGYMMFDAEGSDDELVTQEDLKSPSKMKKAKAFRFGPKKDIFPKVKEDKKEKDGKKEEKEKRKEGKEGKKPKLKVKKKAKHQHLEKDTAPEAIEKPVFGVQLSVALERNRSHDGIQLPAIFRECVDYIEEHGLHCEGIYRISGVKSKVQHLKDQYNRGEPAFLEEHEPNIVAGVLKQFLRELPEPVLTNSLIPKFEEASTIRNEKKRCEAFNKLIHDLPECNRLLLSWMVVHMTHVIERQKENKMTLQNVSIVLSPTMQISHRVLNVLFMHSKQLFKDTVIKRYVPPLKPATSKWSLMLPDNPQALQEELAKQESLLNQLHEALAAGEGDREKEEQIWEVQRVCTQLKRKIKVAQKNQEAIEKRRKERDDISKRNTVLEEGEEELNLELQHLPGEEVLHLELRKPPDDEGQKQEEKDKQRVTVQIETRQDTDQKTHNELEKTGDQESSKPTLKELANQSKVVKDMEKVEKEDIESKDDTNKDVGVEKKDKEEMENEKEITEVRNEAEMKADARGEECTDTTKITETEKMTEMGQTVKAEETAEFEVEKQKKDGKDVEVVEERGSLTVDDVCVSLEKKQEMLLHEDTTDSELGKSQEDIQVKHSESEDEFEQSLEEILERELDIDSDKEIGKVESKECLQPLQVNQEEGQGIPDIVPLETKTPVPNETVELQTTVTPIAPGIEQGKVEKPETNEEDKKVVVSPKLMEVEVIKTPESSEISEEELESFDEEEYNRLLDEEHCLRLEEEELLAIESELRKKIETEKCEIDRLRQEIDELQYLRQDSDEEVMSSSSDSSYESDDEEDLQEILNKLILENEELEKQNSELCGKIHDERMQCLDVKVQIGLLQQKTAQNSSGSQSLMDKDFLIEFD